VLDEDEFAKTADSRAFQAQQVRLIRPTTQHVRLPQMRGPLDNSMRASERKNKSPSEYSNPTSDADTRTAVADQQTKSEPKAGARGRIPTTRTATGGQPEDTPGSWAAYRLRRRTGRCHPRRAPLPKKEMNVIRDEIRKVREQQKLIPGSHHRIQQKTTISTTRP